jgi:UDP-hydrolysing UDP-N-acetyl-D-glucosamine 2-epimerase
MKRVIAVVTGSRADYGLLRPLIKTLMRDGRARVDLIATGSHLDPRFGRTASEIVSDGFRTAARIPLGRFDDSPRGVADAMGRATSGFARAYARLKPDLIVVLGDRWEILAAASAALPFRIPVAHIHGGEASEGLIDEQIRHAVTKLSHIHFPVTALYRRRLLSLGEEPHRVHLVGAPGLDGLKDLPLWTRGRLERELRLPPARPLGLLTYHPVTLEAGAAEREISALLRAIDGFRDVFWVLTLPNAETEFKTVIEKLRAFVRARPDRAAAFSSLGRLRYLSLMKAAAVVAGNSSSGILEAPSFRVPAINVGSRQDGRLKPRSVIDVPRPSAGALRRALSQALSPAFNRSLKGLKNPYAGRNSCARIAGVLLSVPLEERLLMKKLKVR